MPSEYIFIQFYEILALIPYTKKSFSVSSLRDRLFPYAVRSVVIASLPHGTDREKLESLLSSLGSLQEQI
jgi:hypothetical protein